MMSRALVPYLRLLLLLPVLVHCGGEPVDVAPGAAVDARGEEQVAAEGETASPDIGVALLRDATSEWGVRFTHAAGAGGELLFPEMMGGGVAIFDADGDGDLDLYFVSGGGQLRGTAAAADAPVNRLFLQRADGRFEDATGGSGLGDPGYGTGVAVGDVDNDGHQDVLVANVGPDRLFRGLGNGRFEDVTERSGIATGAALEEDWSSSAAFCDVNRDGYLDLYVARYVIWDREVECTDRAGRREYCGPDSFEDQTDRLLLNRGDGSFRDVTSEAGIDVVTGAGLGVVCEDFDDDGWVDVYVANDGDPNQLWMNQRDGSFIDDALIMGTSVNAVGVDEAGMGVVAADFDNDTDYDLFVTHLREETNTFYRNLGPGLGFEDQTTRVGLAASSVSYTGFGTVPLDIDLDGDLDLAIVNGRVLRGDPLTQSLPSPWNVYAEPNLVYANDGGSFRLLGAEVQELTDAVEVSRGLAAGDLDGDGGLDLVVTNIESPARLYRSQPRSGHWLLVDAVDPRLRRRALGARVTASSAAGRQRRTVQGAMSYLSSSDPRAHFGFAEAEAVSLRVRWPDGLEETFADVAVDQVIVLQRGEGAPGGVRVGAP
jgi:hypothetical protein